MAARNYAPLQAQTGSPAIRITWIALKLDPELCPEAVTARGGGLTGAQKCVVRAADQLASRLTGAGFRATVLTEQELTAAVAISSCANPLAIAQAGRTDTPSTAHPGDLAHLALRRPQAYDLLGGPLAAAGRWWGLDAAARRAADLDPGPGHHLQPHPGAR